MRWDPAQYGRFARERGRPFDDLLARVTPAVAPGFVVDLGCGPGNLTATLCDRWPAATVLGVDSSEEMIAAASDRTTAQLHFELGDIATWTSPRPVDVLVSNAALQWVPNHVALLSRLVGMLAPDGWIALQVPGNYLDPSHTLIDDVRHSPRWRDLVGHDGAAMARWQQVPAPDAYVHELAACDGVDLVDVWESTYLHVLAGDDPVWQWMRGTGLRPTLAALPADQRDEFEDDYRARLREAYPVHPFGTLLPFRRLFAVAHREA